MLAIVQLSSAIYYIHTYVCTCIASRLPPDSLEPLSVYDIGCVLLQFPLSFVLVSFTFFLFSTLIVTEPVVVVVLAVVVVVVSYANAQIEAMQLQTPSVIMRNCLAV